METEVISVGHGTLLGGYIGLPYIKHSSITNNFLFLVSEKCKVNTSLDAKDSSRNDGSGHVAAHMFTFRELAAATKYFSADCLLGEGGFGRVYKGWLERTNQVCLAHKLALKLENKIVICLL